jgi:hypothetical protein
LKTCTKFKYGQVVSLPHTYPAGVTATFCHL